MKKKPNKDPEDASIQHLEPESHSLETAPPHSKLSEAEKYMVVCVLSLGGIWSTISGTIYFPALPIISSKFHVSDGLTNVTVVAYLIFQGITPMCVAFIADNWGRRPCIIGCLLAYCSVCIALSRANAFWLLAFLRCLQAGAIAPIIAIGQGVLSDITTSATRGSFVGILSGMQLVGQGFGALVGSGLIDRWGWRGVFVFLAVGSGFSFFWATLMLPETNRSIVGNLSVRPTKLWNKLPIVLLPFFKKRLTNDISTIRERTKADVFASFKILIQKEVIAVLLPGGFLFAGWTMSLTTLSTKLETSYGYSIKRVGLCYLAPGMGTLVGSITTGRILDYVYKRKKTAYDNQYGDLPELDRPKFNILKTRMNLSLVPVAFAMAFFIIFGWCLEKRTSVAPVLVALFFISVCCVSFIASVNTVLVDMFPAQGSGATSCVNLVRCLLGAAGVGALQSMVDAMGEGGTYTLMAGFVGLFTIILYIIGLRKRDDQ